MIFLIVFHLLSVFFFFLYLSCISLFFLCTAFLLFSLSLFHLSPSLPSAFSLGLCTLYISAFFSLSSSSVFIFLVSNNFLPCSLFSRISSFQSVYLPSFTLFSLFFVLLIFLPSFLSSILFNLHFPRLSTLFVTYSLRSLFSSFQSVKRFLLSLPL